MGLPDKKWIGSEQFRLVVLRVHGRYEDGVPEDCTVIKDDMTVELSDDDQRNQFITAYIREAEFNKS